MLRRQGSRVRRVEVRGTGVLSGTAGCHVAVAVENSYANCQVALRISRAENPRRSFSTGPSTSDDISRRYSGSERGQQVARNAGRIGDLCRALAFIRKGSVTTGKPGGGRGSRSAPPPGSGG
jgi:hypothetical protein